ncbi:MAG: adenylate cyclase [Euryarchaeota archaeon]|nr:adenylate cyclase [Euryarchaeota archaeon]
MSKLRTIARYVMTPKKFKSRRQIEKVQHAGMKKHVKFIRKNSPFYARHWDGLSDDQWAEFPLIDKSVMMENLGDLLTVRLDVEQATKLAKKAEQSRDFSSKIGPYSIGFSSGTSGSRGMHFVSEKEQASWAGFMLSRGLDDSILSRQNIGLILRANSNTFESIGSKRIKFKFYDLMKPLEEIHQMILQDDLDILIGPPSVLRYLADVKSSLKVNKLVSAAEVLDEIDRRHIEQHFGQIAHQFYSSTEGEIAATCEFGTLHLNEGIMVIQKEWVDEEKGWYHPIISDFKRSTQPIIRYRLNDILVASKQPCKCGDARESIDSIMGRQDDIFLLKKRNGGEYEQIVPDFIRRAVMQMHPDITAYRAIQRSADEIEVQLLPEALEQVSLEGFDLVWQQKNVETPKIIITKYEHKPSATKLRRIQREFTIS